MQRSVIAVDLAKSVFQIAVSSVPGTVDERPRVSRRKFLEFFANRAPATIVMEACGSAHHWGRELTELDHEVVLLPAQYVRPYVRRNKTDRTDAKGLLEAYRDQEIRPVPIKSLTQQSLVVLHRLRSGWIESRTAWVNALRGHLRELGLFIPVGRRKVVPQVREWIADADLGVPMAIRDALYQVCEEIDRATREIEALDRQIENLGRQIEEVRRLETIPGIGWLTATALFMVVGDIERFPSGRHLASYLGLTPRERSSGGKRWLGGISKRGDAYLRTLLVHGARGVLAWAKRRGPKGRLEAWALEIENRRGPNKAAVALANKQARVVWAVWKNETFEHLSLAEDTAA